MNKSGEMALITALSLIRGNTTTRFDNDSTACSSTRVYTK